jgi:methionyl-tRNA formyltransferase
VLIVKIIFFGSDDFAAVHLKELLASEHQVLAVVTQPDRAKGRGLEVVLSPIKTIGLDAKLPVFQPENLKDKTFTEKMKSFNCDLFVVIAYGRILPPELLQVPYVCAINVHGSLLPKYRGAAPINWAIINGDKETGVSIIKMNAGMDAGDIFSQAKLKIDDSDTAASLRAKMAEAGKKLLLKTIDSFEKNAYTLNVQDSHAVTLAPKLTKELGKIDWQKSAVEVHNLVRGLVPWPSAYTGYQGKLLKILATEIAKTDNKGKPGQVVEVTKDALIVATGKGSLALKKVQPESAKAMDIKSFVAGHKITAGFQFGK